MNAERLITGTILLACIFVMFAIIPDQVEQVDYGRIKPDTLPKIVTLIIAIAAAIQLFTEREKTILEPIVILRSILFLALIIGSVYLMSLTGFEFVAPLLSLAVMWLIGERRWYWLLSGCVIIPLGSWLIVEQMLNRVLL